MPEHRNNKKKQPNTLTGDLEWLKPSRAALLVLTTQTTGNEQSLGAPVVCPKSARLGPPRAQWDRLSTRSHLCRGLWAKPQCPLEPHFLGSTLESSRGEIEWKNVEELMLQDPTNRVDPWRCAHDVHIIQESEKTFPHLATGWPRVLDAN